jgi:DHA2 family lincomycin resistance protein-like MFS transporter
VIMDNRAGQLVASGATEVEAFVGGIQWAFATGAVIGVVVIVTALMLPSKVEAPEGAPVGH